ncbi:MAG: AAA family ATPase [Phycisphaerae bacterium]|nr:AAA family ATPase [Phycisphaerae bacterium]
MHITRVYIDGFKRLTKFDLQLNENLNVIVGDNETGKTSVLEAINLVLTRQYDGRTIDYALDPYFFNSARVRDYFATLRSGKNAAPPEILIEAYLNDDSSDPEPGKLKGTHNHGLENCPGLRLIIEPNKDYTDELKEYVCDKANPEVVPVEYYAVHWQSFKGDPIKARNVPLKAKLIDTSVARAYRGPNKYVSQLVNDDLEPEQRHMLSLAYKKLRHEFAKGEGVKAINDALEEKDHGGTSRKLTVQMDLSSRSSWESAITPHLDDLPFDCVGKGEQCRVQMRVAIAGAEKSRVLLIEEPENHLSHSNMSMLMAEIAEQCDDKHQVVLSTHSAFVLNKLGIDNLKLISEGGKPISLSDLDSKTTKYFMKLPGYDTLRLILAKRSILVEGPSDELIVQRAYRDRRGVLPLERGVDVISVGTAFKRFLEIAALLKLNVCAVMDNDGKVANLKERYTAYIDGTHETVELCYDEDGSCPTLEPQLLKVNSLELINTILDTRYGTDERLIAHMTDRKNKTECALRFFETNEVWTAPEYILRAIQ